MSDTQRWCPSCRARAKYGHPNPSDNWSKLNLSTRMFYILQQAAAEFDQLSQEAGEYPTAMEFLDWLAPSIPGTAQFTASQKREEAEGLAIMEYPNRTGEMRTRTTTTDPLPFAPLRGVFR